MCWTYTDLFKMTWGTQAYMFVSHNDLGTRWHFSILLIHFWLFSPNILISFQGWYKLAELHVHLRSCFCAGDDTTEHYEWQSDLGHTGVFAVSLCAAPRSLGDGVVDRSAAVPPDPVGEALFLAAGSLWVLAACISNRVKKSELTERGFPSSFPKREQTFGGLYQLHKTESSTWELRQYIYVIVIFTRLSFLVSSELKPTQRSQFYKNIKVNQ